MKIYDAAKIPVVNIDVWHPNGIFFGADNYVSGEIGGKAAGEYAKGARQVRRGDDLQRRQPRRGRRRRAAHGRLHRRRPGGLRRRPRRSDRRGNLRRRHHRAGADQDDRLADGPSRRDLRRSAPRSTTPAPPASPRRSPRTGATAPRSASAATRSASPRPRRAIPATTKFLGCVAYFPEKYPDYVMSIGLDVLDGKPVPNEVHIEHVFLDKDIDRLGLSLSQVHPHQLADGRRRCSNSTGSPSPSVPSSPSTASISRSARPRRSG